MLLYFMHFYSHNVSYTEYFLCLLAKKHFLETSYTLKFKVCDKITENVRQVVKLDMIWI